MKTTLLSLRRWLLPIAIAIVTVVTGCEDWPAEPPQIPASAASPEKTGITFDGTKLVFPDEKTFAETYVLLASASADSSTDPWDDEVLRFEGQFPAFESMRAVVEREIMTSLEEGTFSPETNPDDQYLPDPFLRTLLNQAGEVQIGDSAYRFSMEGISVTNGKVTGGCCWMYRNVSEFEGSLSSRFIISKSWVYNVPIPIFWFGVIGSSTRSFERVLVGNQYQIRPAVVPRIATGATYTKADLTCANGNTQSGAYTKYNYTSSYVAHSDWWYTFTFPMFVVSHQAAHRADYSAATLVDITSLCL